MNFNMRKKLGLFFVILGLIGGILLFVVKESNQPVYVSSSFGSGYMGGWSDSTNDMLDIFIGACAIEAIIGVDLIITSNNKKNKKDEEPQY